MKSALKLIYPLIGIILLSSLAQGSNDPWVQHYRKNQKMLSSTLKDKNGEPIKFFNTLAVGGSVGASLFHGSLADYETFAPLSDGGKYYNFAWRVYAEREIKWGVRGKLQFEKGELSGGRLPGLQSLPVTFSTDFNTLSFVLSFDLLNSLFNKDDDEGLKGYKFYFNGELGIGMTWFRSVSWWDTERNLVRDFVGYTVTNPDAPTSRYLLKAKDSPEIAFNIPVGFTAGYRINYKTDVTLSYTLNNTMTKKLDTWSREFNSNDKYSYFGVGLRYNFNREKEDYPPKKEKPSKEEKDKWKLFGSKKEDVQPNEVDLAIPVESRQSNPIDPASQNQDLEEIRMKMFELQLKLFEMQYLLNGGSPPKENGGTKKTPGQPAQPKTPSK